jgi:hypothetical protein
MKTNRSNRKSVNGTTSHKEKVDIEVLRQRIFEKKKKKQIQNRIMFVSALVSVGVISYFAG